MQRYRQRISGPLLDRIDLRVEVVPPTLEELAPSPAARASAPSDPTTAQAALAERIRTAKSMQRDRQGLRANAALDADELDRCAPLSGAVRELLARAVRQRDLSARALQSLRRVARTLADLDASRDIAVEHVARALALRSPIL